MYRRVRRLFDIYAAYHLPEQSPHPRRDRLRLVPPFLAAGTRAFPHAYRWARYRDASARARVKQLLDLSGPAPLALDPRLFAPSPQEVAQDTAPSGVTLVMPVYGALPMVQQALARVAETDIPWRIVLVDDASPDPDTLPFLRRWAAEHPAELLALPENLGFVGAANAGLKQALFHPDPVVLLNSDALLPKGWARRLLRPLRDGHVASVTPLSNDAELGSVPEAGRATTLTAEQGDALDHVAQGLSGLPPVAAPAGVGFCMALSRAALEEVPRFDSAFAPGYGEEVDWCQKLAARGFSHVYAPDLFVAHIGGQSFGSARKQALIGRNSALLTRRYPRFDAQVHGFLRRDPLVSARLALGLARAELLRRGPLPIYLAHSMGGGAEVDLRRRLESDLSEIGAAVVLRVGGVFRFHIELWTARQADHSTGDTTGITAAGTNDWAQVAQLLAPITARRLVYSCAVGDPDPVALPDHLLALRGAEDQLEVLIHDYFPLSPNATLLETGERWEGLPDPARASARHLSHRSDGRAVPLKEWQSRWGRLLGAADHVTCFSHAAQHLVESTYPEVQTRLRPHRLPVAVPALPPRQLKAPEAAGGCVLGLLGNLAPHKGAAVAQDLAVEIASNGGAHKDTGLVLLGEMDPAFSLPAPAVKHGQYRVEDLPALAARYGITCWFIPSLWPETFSFTTHEALATGLPVLTFDLGAQAEALRNAGPQRHCTCLPLSLRHKPSAILTEAKRLSAVPTCPALTA